MSVSSWEGLGYSPLTRGMPKMLEKFTSAADLDRNERA